MSNVGKRDLTVEQEDALNKLSDQRAAKFEEIIALLSQQAGNDESATLDPEIHRKFFDEAMAEIDRWMERAEMDRREPSTATLPTPLQRLLNEHYELAEQRLDILDGVDDEQ